MHTFKIHAPLNANEAFIEMDGKRIEGVTRIEFGIAAKSIVKLNLTVMGYVDIAGEFRESELIKVEREGEHQGMLRARVRRAFQAACPAMDDDKIGAMTADVMNQFEREPS